MTREEAIKLANQLVGEWIASPPTNQRGYSDGWKPPTVGERTAAVLRLAEYLSGTTLAAPLPPEQE